MDFDCDELVKWELLCGAQSGEARPRCSSAAKFHKLH